MSRNKKSCFSGTPGGLILRILLVNAGLGAWLWPYTINSWLVYAGKPEAILWWHGTFFAFVPVMGQLTIPAAVVTFVLLLFL